jgi:hypothetical protein
MFANWALCFFHSISSFSQRQPNQASHPLSRFSRPSGLRLCSEGSISAAPFCAIRVVGRNREHSCFKVENMTVRNAASFTSIPAYVVARWLQAKLPANPPRKSLVGEMQCQSLRPPYGSRIRRANFPFLSGGFVGTKLPLRRNCLGPHFRY